MGNKLRKQVPWRRERQTLTQDSAIEETTKWSKDTGETISGRRGARGREGVTRETIAGETISVEIERGMGVTIKKERATVETIKEARASGETTKEASATRETIQEARAPGETTKETRATGETIKKERATGERRGSSLISELQHTTQVRCDALVTKEDLADSYLVF